MAQHFDISVTAAAAHVGNVSRVQVALPPGQRFPEPSDEIKAQENFMIDLFPIRESPPAVVGGFAWVVARALSERLISRDSAATFLRTTADKLSARTVDTILNLAGPL